MVADCRWREWSKPVQLQSRVVDRLARFPRLAVGSRTAYIIGASFQLLDDRVMGASPLQVWNIGGEDLGRPPGTFKYLYPRGAVDSHDRLHVIWGEPAPESGAVSAARWVFLPSTELWTATFDPTSGWSPAHQIDFKASSRDGIKWDWHGTADNLGSERPQGIGLEERRRQRGIPLTYLRLTPDGLWAKATLDVPREARWINILSNDRRTFAAYTLAGTGATAPSHRLSATSEGAIFIRTSVDREETWGAPLAVANSMDHRAQELHAMLSKGGYLHLIWKQETSRGLAIRHVASHDEGATWSVPQDIVPAAQFENMRAVVDACDNVHVIFEDWRGGPDSVHIDYAMWDGRWSTVQHVTEGRLSMTPDLRVLANGQPVMAFVAGVPAASGSTTFATFHSELER